MWIADSYAKINLGLHLLEHLPQAGGHHHIETGLAFIDWRDRFEIKQAPEMKLEINSEEIPADGKDSINKALAALNRYVGLQHNYLIRVDKRIPSGAGLGAKSSNAALTLRMINKIEELGLSEDELIDLSRDIGTDVPFFIKGETGISKELGHQINYLDIQPNYSILCCYPDEQSNSSEAYMQAIANPNPDFDLEDTLTNAPLEELRYTLFNDLEQSVFPRVNVAGNLKDQMYEFGASYASMTGSGSAVYGVFEQNFVATEAYKGLLDLELPCSLTKPNFEPDYGIYRKG